MSADGAWMVARLRCLSCSKRWVLVYPAWHDAELFECPRCGKVAGQKQPLEDE